MMTTKTSLPFLNSKFLTIFILAMGFFAIQGFAQETQEKVILETRDEAPIVEDLDLSKGQPSLATPSPQRKIASPPVKSTPTKKVNPDTLVENKEIKKEEGASTLSFNLFLYIVDKFKAD
ncbi:hypothetical protein [Algoriphagus namhaensis]